MKGIFFWRETITPLKSKGQIAALLTIVIAIVILMIAITINIGKVSQTKTAVNLSADGASLLLASTLSSQATYFSEEYLDGGTHKCKINWLGLLGVIIFIIGAILAIVSGGSTTALCKIGLGLMAIGGLGALQYNAIIQPSQIAQFNRLMADMTEEQMIYETPIQYALFQLCNDPQMIIDVNDYDEDGYTDDIIGRFSAWYTWRLYILTESANALKEAIKRLKWWVNAFLTDDSEVFRAYIDGGDIWPLDPDGDMANLLREIEAGVEYDYISSRTWDRYINSGDTVYDRDVTILQLASNPGEVQYDFSFWVDGSNPNNENDPVNDDVDFFLEDLKSFWDYCYNEEYRDCVEECRANNPPTRDDDNAFDQCVAENCYKGWLQEDLDTLTVGVDVWYPSLKGWIEDTFYTWRRDDGPLYHWRRELLNWNVNRYNGSVQREFNNAITNLGYQLRNNRGHYLGGLYAVLESRTDPANPWTAAELDHLNGLIDTIEEDLEMLKGYASSENPYYIENARSYQKNINYAAYQIERWRIKYTEFRVNDGGWNDFKRIYEMVKHPKFAEYTWTDSLGSHTVRADVEVTPYYPTDDDTILPTVEQYSRSLGFEKCMDLKNYRGEVKVTVNRSEDIPEQDINLATRLLWRFTHPNIRKISRAHYGIRDNDIYLYR